MNAKPLHTDDAAPLAHSIENAGKRAGLGRTTMFKLIRTGQLQALKCGKRTIITEDALRTLLASLPHAQ
jgi:hypothetical protein